MDHSIAEITSLTLSSLPLWQIELLCVTIYFGIVIYFIFYVNRTFRFISTDSIAYFEFERTRGKKKNEFMVDLFADILAIKEQVKVKYG